MSYTALYRKFRPDNFDDVKGQDHIVTTHIHYYTIFSMYVAIFSQKNKEIFTY